MVFPQPTGRIDPMASLEKRGGSFRVVFRFGGVKFSRGLSTSNEKAALSAVAQLEDNLRRIELGVLAVPEGADIVAFLLSDGRVDQKPQLQGRPNLTLKQLFERCFAALPDGNLERTTIQGMQIHERQLIRHFGSRFQIHNLTLTLLQQYVDKRSRQKGLHGEPVTAVTIKKAIVTLRTVWNWGMQHGLIDRRYPNKGLKFPKSEEKPPFQTFEEVQLQAKNASPKVAAELWECVFLTLGEIDELLEFVKRNARQPFIYPMFVFAAHTGARRSEIIRSKLRDLNFNANLVTIHERKKSHDKRTTRRLPMSPRLRTVLKEWLAVHPGGDRPFPPAPSSSSATAFGRGCWLSRPAASPRSCVVRVRPNHRCASS